MIWGSRERDCDDGGFRAIVLMEIEYHRGEGPNSISEGPRAQHSRPHPSDQTTPPCHATHPLSPRMMYLNNTFFLCAILYRSRSLLRLVRLLCVQVGSYACCLLPALLCEGEGEGTSARGMQPGPPCVLSPV